MTFSSLARKYAQRIIRRIQHQESIECMCRDNFSEFGQSTHPCEPAFQFLFQYGYKFIFKLDFTLFCFTLDVHVDVDVGLDFDCE